jgi:hypothetical protein
MSYISSSLKANRLRKEVENSNLEPEYKDIEEGSASREIKINSLSSLQMLFTQTCVIVLALHKTSAFGFVYLVFSTLSVFFEQTYNETTGIAGLNNISIGLNLFPRASICGKIPC